MSAKPFGPLWSEALVFGAEEIAVPFPWVLAVFALESGFNPAAENKSSGARGLWQKMPLKTPDGKRIPYAVIDPVTQMQDAFRFWGNMQKTFNTGKLATRESFYCLNLAPARLANGASSASRVLYSSKHDLHPAEYWLAGYKQNEHLDADHKGWITIGDLAPKLDQYVRKCQEKYDLESCLAQAIQDVRACGV